MQLALADEGYRVHWCERGRPGLSAAVAEKPAVVLLDLMLPDIDGRHVLRLLKADPVTRDIPVIVVSAIAYRLTSDEVDLTAATIGKPFEIDRLLASVRYAAYPDV